MKALYSGSKVYKLYDDREHDVGSLTYTSIFSQCSIIKANDSDPINLTPKKLCSAVVMSQKNQELGTLKMKWWTMFIEFKYNNRKDAFTFKKIGFWKTRFILLNEEKVQVISLTPQFRWKSMKYDYLIELNPSERYKVGKDIMLLSVYCANYIKAMASSAV